MKVGRPPIRDKFSGVKSACERYRLRHLGLIAQRVKDKYHSNPSHRRRCLARATVRNAIQAGKLTRQPCELCGSSDDVEAHHDDYDKPLVVRWLCRKHHRELHDQL